MQTVLQIVKTLDLMCKILFYSIPFQQMDGFDKILFCHENISFFMNFEQLLSLIHVKIVYLQYEQRNFDKILYRSFQGFPL